MMSPTKQALAEAIPYDDPPQPEERQAAPRSSVWVAGRLTAGELTIPCDVLNVSAGAEAAACKPIAGDLVAVVGDNRKMLIFPLKELPEMTRGRGVILQRYAQGGLADVATFTMAEGLSWQIGERTRTETDLKHWVGKRAQTGRKVPRGFSKNNRFA